jgi:preprotein translocase SecE subunit
MFKFLKESIKEFDHVVWPTQEETKKYFSFVCTFIAVFATFLFIVGSLFSAGIFSARDAASPLRPTPQTPLDIPSGSGSLPDFNLDDFGSVSGEKKTIAPSGARAPISSESSPIVPLKK